jgi:hypothetical protein
MVRAMEPLIRLGPGTDEHGLAGMLAGLVRQNLDQDPSKKASFRRLEGRIAIVADDADAAVTLLFERGQLTVHRGLVGIPDVTIRAPTEHITKLSVLETRRLPGGLHVPDPAGTTLREVARASAAGAIKVHGLPFHLPLVLRLSRLLSVS